MGIFKWLKFLYGVYKLTPELKKLWNEVHAQPDTSTKDFIEHGKEALIVKAKTYAQQLLEGK